jgi:hypothetical protein
MTVRSSGKRRLTAQQEVRIDDRGWTVTTAAARVLEQAEKDYLIVNGWHTKLEGNKTVWICPFMPVTCDKSTALGLQKQKDRSDGLAARR